MKRLITILFLFISTFGFSQIQNNGMFYFNSGGASNGLLNNLFADYSLDETSGTDVFDSQGNYDGTNTGATVNQSGKVGTSYYFTDATDFITFGDIGASPFDGSTSTISVSVWVYLTDMSGNNFIVAKFSNYSGNRDRTFYLGVTDAGACRTLFGDNGSSYQYYDTTTGLISTDAWYHIVMVADISTDDVVFYVNNSSPYSTSKTLSGTTRTVIYNGVYPLNIARIQNSSAASFSGITAGYVDQVDIWNVQISSDMVAALYNSDNGLAFADFTAYLELKNRQLWEQFYTKNNIQIPLKPAA